MAAGDIQIGLDGKLLQGAAGSTASTEAVNAEDVTLNLTTEEVDITRRGATWTATKPVLVSAELTFTLQKREGDAVASALRTAFLAKGRIALFAKDSDTGTGLDADFYVTGMSDNQPLKDKQTWAVTAKPTDEERDPAWA